MGVSLVARTQTAQHGQHFGQLARQTRKLIFDSVEPPGLLALVVFDPIEPAAVQVKGLLNCVQCIVRRGLQRVEVVDVVACLSHSPRDVRVHRHRRRQ